LLYRLHGLDRRFRANRPYRTKRAERVYRFDRLDRLGRFNLSRILDFFHRNLREQISGEYSARGRVFLSTI
jgi:hypothetical protein